MMTINIAALVNSASKWGYQGAGDVLLALGVDDINDFEGTIADALRVLEANARGGSVPAAPPENGGEVEKEPVDDAFLAAYRDEIASMPEAPVVAWTRFQRYPGGPTWSLTIRAGLSPECMSFALNETMRGIAAFDKYVHDKGYAAVLDGRDQAAFPVERAAQGKPKAAPAPTQAPQSARTAPPLPPAPPQASGEAREAPSSAPGVNGEHPSGTATLNKITVDADGRVEFHVGNFRWPFKDSRGGEVVAGLFDESLGWTPAHFAPGAKYEGEAVAGLVVDWEKPTKYYDVVRVRRA